MNRIALLVAAAAAVQWLVFAAVSVFSRAPLAKKARTRPQESALLASTVVLLAAWVWAFDGVSFFREPFATPAVEASVAPAKRAGSCASIENGMAAAAVEERLGEPDEVRSSEEIRGPGAVTWTYRDSRCTVHLLDERVEFIE